MKTLIFPQNAFFIRPCLCLHKQHTSWSCLWDTKNGIKNLVNPTILVILIQTIFLLQTLPAQAQNLKWLKNPEYEQIILLDSGGYILKSKYSKKKYAVLNNKGQLIIEPKYDYISEFNNNMAIVKQNSLYGFIDANDKIIIPLKFESVKNLSEDIVGFRHEGKWGLIKINEDTLLKPQFTNIRSFSEGMLAVQIATKWGFINKKGIIIIEPQFETVEDFKNNLAKVKVNDQWALIDKTGKFVVEPYYENFIKFFSDINEIERNKTNSNFDYIRSFRENLACARLKHKWGVIDNKGKVIIEPHYDNISDFSNGLFKVTLNGKSGIIDIKDNIIIPIEYEDYELYCSEGLIVKPFNVEWVVKTCDKYFYAEGVKTFFNKIIAVKIDKNWKLYNPYEKDVLSCDSVFEYSDFVNFRTNNKWGIMNNLGKIIAQPQFYNIYTTTQYINNLGTKIINNTNIKMGDLTSINKIQHNSLWGLVSEKGKTIIEPQFDYISDFKDGYAQFKLYNYWGVIDTTGKIIVNAKHNIVLQYEKNYFRVENNGKWGLINKKGKFVIDPQFAEIVDYDKDRVIVKDFVSQKYGVVEISLIPPTISVLSPAVQAGKAQVSTESLTLKGRVTDDMGVRSVQINGKTAFLSPDGEFVLTDLPLFEGENKINIEAEDVNGNTAVSVFTVQRTQAQAEMPKNQKIGIDKAEGKHYYALVIAVQDYKFINKLNKPLRDADSLIRTLTTFYQFEKERITYLQNPERDGIIEALDSLMNNVLGEQDNLLVFYAGHGHLDKVTDAQGNSKDVGYWLPVDAKAPSANSRAKWISNNTLKDEYLARMKCKHILLVTDACFSGSIFREVKDERNATTPKNDKQKRDEQIKLAGLYNKKSRQAMTSGKMTVVADESLFLRYMLQNLRETDKIYLTVSELFSNFSKTVIDNTKQTPELGVIHESGDEGGEFIFIKR